MEALGGIVAKLSDRLTALEAQAQAAREIQSAREDALKAQVETIALREVQAAVNAVQGGFNQRLAEVRLEIDRLVRPGGLAQIGA